MAPEVLSRKWYNPQVADIWSLAIIYCCMIMGKFPWMVAQCSDDAFAHFASLQSLQSRTDQVPSDLTVRSCEAVTITTQKIATKSSASIICTITETKDGHDDTKTSRGRPEAWGGLSQGSWEAISSLLQIDCHHRGDLQQLTGSPWFKQIQVCCWEDSNGSVSDCTHQHV
jgi:serine/threonine protein kinase